jgi:hypothetical protein
MNASLTSDQLLAEIDAKIAQLRKLADEISALTSNGGFTCREEESLVDAEARTHGGFNAGEIVKGRVCGTFKIVGFRSVDGEPGADLRCVDTISGAVAGPPLYLPLDCLRKI